MFNHSSSTFSFCFHDRRCSSKTCARGIHYPSLAILIVSVSIAQHPRADIVLGLLCNLRMAEALIFNRIEIVLFHLIHISRSLFALGQLSHPQHIKHKDKELYSLSKHPNQPRQP